MPQPTILLFDIDGTLVTTGGAGRRALQRTFHEAFGHDDVFAGFPFAGMTDPAIVREGYRRIGREYEEKHVESLLNRYVAVLEEELKSTPDHRLHNGMKSVLDEARGQNHIALGLGTGNIERGARAKLAPLGVYEHFRFGGFGSDHEDRAQLIGIGARRGAELLGASVEKCRLVIIGDTPKDIAAAKANDGECLAVTTGSFDRDGLVGAEYVCADLTDGGARDFLFRS